MTLMELVIAMGLASLLFLITVQILNVSSMSMSTVRAITTFEGFKNQLLAQMAGRANCAKILGSGSQTINPALTVAQPINLFSVVDGSPYMVGSEPYPNQNMAGAGVQITGITLQAITSGSSFNLVGSSNSVAGATQTATNFVLANMTLTAQISGANGVGAVNSTFGTSQLQESIGLMLELDNGNHIVSCSSQNADSVKPFNLPACTPGNVLVFIAAVAGGPPFWQCMAVPP